MIVDSNVIIRLLRNDVPGQTRRAAVFFKKVEKGEEKASISILVLDEIIWGLGQFYEIKREDFLPKIIRILSLKGIEVIELKKDKIVEILMEMIVSKIDFTDLYLMAIAKSDEIFSFDTDFKKMMSKQVE